MTQPRIALVTGASRRIGIGTAICRALAAQGMDIAFSFWHPYDQQMEWGDDQDAPTLLVSELENMGRRSLALSAILSQPTTSTELLDQI